MISDVKWHTPVSRLLKLPPAVSTVVIFYRFVPIFSQGGTFLKHPVERKVAFHCFELRKSIYNRMNWHKKLGFPVNTGKESSVVFPRFISLLKK